MPSSVHCEIEDRVARVRFDDGKANAIGDTFCRELGAALDRAEAEGVEAVVMSGRPGYFSAGLDVKVLPTLSPDEVRAFTDVYVALMVRVFLFPSPVVAVAQGHSMAGGMILFLAADHRIALDDDSHRYGLNEVANGVPLVGANLGICQAAIPPHRHTELLLHAKMGTPRSFAEGGAIQELVSDVRELEARTEAAVAHVRKLDAAAYRVTKRLMRQSFVTAAEEGLRAGQADMPQGNFFSKLER